ncbi:MAG: D-alanine--D-alanine ligase [Candidatus Omnitrophota bacterium]|nr:D-alanine--D-alanine ligase [Candidatus Omnitrophota bacterium]
MSKAKKLGKIAVLAGGPSNERSVSIKSGRAVYNALKREGCDVVRLELADSNTKREIRKEPFNIAFIALHGRFGEDGTVQKMLERMSIPYTGSGSAASRLALDKITAQRIFKKRGIPAPEHAFIDRVSMERLKELPFPLVVKPRNEGSSIGLSVVRGRREFSNACELAFRYSSKIIVEKFIKGREITVGILDKKALPVVEIIPKRFFYDFYAKYRDSNTGYVVPADIPKDLCVRAQAIGLAAHNALGCKDFSRVDMKFDEDGSIYVLEVNTIPGLTARSLFPKAAGAAGMAFDKLCLKLLKLAVKNRYDKR